jgi:hypothetical protein
MNIEFSSVAAEDLKVDTCEKNKKAAKPLAHQLHLSLHSLPLPLGL